MIGWLYGWLVGCGWPACLPAGLGSWPWLVQIRALWLVGFMVGCGWPACPQDWDPGLDCSRLVPYDWLVVWLVVVGLPCRRIGILALTGPDSCLMIGWLCGWPALPQDWDHGLDWSRFVPYDWLVVWLVVVGLPARRTGILALTGPDSSLVLRVWIIGLYYFCIC